MKIQYPKNYIVWDLETSGLDPKVDKILEFAAVEYKNGEEVARETFLIDHPGFEVPEKIKEITGISTELCHAEGIDPGLALRKMYTFLGRRLPNVTHNGLRFDLEFLLKAIGRGGAPIGQYNDGLTGSEYQLYEANLYHGMIDTAVLFKAGKLGRLRRFNETFREWGIRVMEERVFGLKYNVGVCCDDLGIEITTQHRALGDVLLTNEIYKKLVA